MRILWSSNAPWSCSGYGVQGASLLPRLLKLDEVEDIAVHAWYGLQGGIFEWEGMKIYPMWRDPYGNDVVKDWATDFRADVVISLIDPWVLHDMANKLSPVEWWPWFPIDVEPASHHTLNAIKGASKKLVYSRWAQELLKEAGVETIYIPHGIEPSKYKVLEPNETRKIFRDSHFGEDAEFVVTMVAANKGEDDRKAFSYQLQAFARFAKDKPNVRLWMHTDPSMASRGVDIATLIHRLHIAEKIRFPVPQQLKKGYPVDWMSALYNSSDVYLGAAKSEGFGIPLIEAQACGIPVVTTNFSAQPELLRWGKLVDVAELEWCNLGGWRAVPSVDGIHTALEELYAEWKAYGWDMDERLDTSKKIHDEFGWDSVVEDYWKPLIQEHVKQ